MTHRLLLITPTTAYKSDPGLTHGVKSARRKERVAEFCSGQAVGGAARLAMRRAVAQEAIMLRRERPEVCLHLRSVRCGIGDSRRAVRGVRAASTRGGRQGGEGAQEREPLSTRPNISESHSETPEH